MRGGVAISVTATPAAAPRRSRAVLRIIIREPSGIPSLRNSTYKYGLACIALARATVDPSTSSLSLGFSEKKRNKQRLRRTSSCYRNPAARHAGELAGLGRCLNGKIGRFLSLEYAVDVTSRSAITV